MEHLQCLQFEIESFSMICGTPPVFVNNTLYYNNILLTSYIDKSIIQRNSSMKSRSAYCFQMDTENQFH